MAEEKITRTYTVPLRRGFNETPRYKRTNKAVRVLREFLVKHMKSENIRLGDKLNELIWAKGIKNPPPRVKITVTKDKEGIVRAELEGTEYKDFKQQDKKEEPKSAKEKLQSAVKGAKGDKKETKEEAEKPAEAKAEKKPATPKPEVKKETPKTPATQSNTTLRSGVNEVASAPKPKVSSVKAEAPKAEPLKEEAKKE